ncbi:unnamed protein product [Durusdinium trenchii]|uniref:DUF202 domain-containing protein n=1 Tax=Durusdinium trenchii TaxID=1381693 RepID=A0ABP0S9C0_9DINO
MSSKPREAGWALDGLGLQEMEHSTGYGSLEQLLNKKVRPGLAKKFLERYVETVPRICRWQRLEWHWHAVASWLKLPLWCRCPGVGGCPGSPSGGPVEQVHPPSELVLQQAREPSADRGNLAEPLLSKTEEQAPPEGVWQRLLGAEAQQDEDKPVRRAIVAVQPKTLYSNERTFLEWIHFATILAASGILMLHATQEAGHVMIGRLMVLASIFLVVWSMHVFNWRADGLDFKVDMSYEDHVGPLALIGSILGALILSGLHAAYSVE